MRGSGAFEAIDDPADPAWIGHAPALRWHGRRGVRQAFVATITALVAIGALLLVVDRGDRADPRSGSVAASAAQSTTDSNARPLLGDGSTIVVPQGGAGDMKTSSAERAGAAEPGAAASGSGWAPAQATRKAYSPDRVRGDTSGISPLVTGRLDDIARELGAPIDVISGWRTTHEQSELYQRYLAGTGNLAAVPGSSMHEVGRAADVYIDGVALASVTGARRIALAHGIHFPVRGEPWHAELVGDPDGSGKR